MGNILISSKNNRIELSENSVHFVRLLKEPIIKYGLLYNWYAATDVRKITSSDTWRVTESADWKALLLDLGGIDQGSIVRSELPDEFGQYPLRNHYPLCDSDPQYWNTFVGTNTLNFNFRGSGCRVVLYDEETETINTYFDYKGDYGYSLCSDTSNGNELFIYIRDHYAVLFLSFWSTSPTAKKTGYPIRLVRPATAEELLLSDGTACANYTGNDGKVYRTVKIGTQVWLADNLLESKYRDDSLIPIVEDNTTWANLTTGACCYYNNDSNNG